MSGDRKSFKYWAKAVVNFIGQSLLFSLGLLLILGTFVEIFEGRASLGELSLLEILFVALFVLLLKRHAVISREVGFSWPHTLYRPFRDIGWLCLVCLVCLVCALFLVLGGQNLDELYLYLIVNSNALQRMGFLLILCLVYFATPIPPKGRAESIDLSAERDAE